VHFSNTRLPNYQLSYGIESHSVRGGIRPKRPVGSHCPDSGWIEGRRARSAGHTGQRCTHHEINSARLSARLRICRASPWRRLAFVFLAAHDAGLWIEVDSFPGSGCPSARRRHAARLALARLSELIRVWPNTISVCMVRTMKKRFGSRTCAAVRER